MSELINVGIIGFGLAGRVFHAPNISSIKGASIKTIYTSNAENIRTANQLYPEAEVVADVEKIFQDPTIDLVVIASPNESHYSLAEAAILAGKHLVVDKPFMITSSDADKIIKLAKEKNVLLSVFQNRRWDSDFLTVKKIIEGQMLGKIVEFESHFDRYAPEIKEGWRNEDIPGSGMLYDLGAHLIDQAVDLFGKPESVMADVRTQREGAKVNDNFEVILSFKGGLKAVLKSSMLVRADLPRFILFGQNGTFIKFGMDVQEDYLKAGLAPNSRIEWGKEPEEIHGIIQTTLNGSNLKGRIESERGDYSAYYKNILAAIHKKEEVIVKPEQARNTIRIIEYAIQSYSQGGKVACMDLI